MSKEQTGQTKQAEVVRRSDSVSEIAMGHRGISLTTFEDLWRFSSAIAKTGMVPDADRGKPDQIAAKIQMGLELGFTPMQALKAFYAVNGRVGMEALAMKAVAVNSGLMEACEHGVQGTGQSMKGYCRVKRAGHEPREFTFTVEQAKRAKLVDKDAWKTYPEDMLEYRAMSRAFRKEFPDVIFGLYTPEELEDLPPPTSEGARRTISMDRTKENIFGLPENVQNVQNAEKPPESAPEASEAEDDAQDEEPAEDLTGRNPGDQDDPDAELRLEVGDLANQLVSAGIGVEDVIAGPLDGMGRSALSVARVRLRKMVRELEDAATK